MSSIIKKDNIVKCTRADSFWTTLTLADADGNVYEPDPEDYILFSLKTSTSDDEEPLVKKVIPPDTLELRLDPEDLDYDPGIYWYDVELTHANIGKVDTVIPPTKFIISEQVGDKRRWG